MIRVENGWDASKRPSRFFCRDRPARNHAKITDREKAAWDFGKTSRSCRKSAMRFARATFSHNVRECFALSETGLTKAPPTGTQIEGQASCRDLSDRAGPTSGGAGPVEFLSRRFSRIPPSKVNPLPPRPAMCVTAESVHSRRGRSSGTVRGWRCRPSTRNPASPFDCPWRRGS